MVDLEKATATALTDPEVVEAGITSAADLLAYQVASFDAAMDIVNAWGGRKTGSLVVTLAAGAVQGIVPATSWQAPAAPPNPMQVALDELAANVAKMPISIHSTRAEDQKTYMKDWGIPWIKAHPEATPGDAAAAIMTALRAEFPNDPIVDLIYDRDPVSGREDGLLMSYADSAHTMGLISDKTWQALRGLIVAAPEQQLRAALRIL